MLTAKHLVQSTLPNVSTLLYTATNVRTRIDAAAVVNTSGAAALYSVYLVPPLAAVGTAYLLVKDRSIAANSAARVLEIIGQWLEPGWTIYAAASVAAVINLNVSGLEQTTQ